MPRASDGTSNQRPAPRALLRYFDEEKYAREFVAGRMRFGLLATYHNSTDQRQDKTEGSTHVVWKGGSLQNPVYCGRESLNPYYILSTSSPDADRMLLMKRFGAWVVRIEDPQELLRRIGLAWQAHPLALGPCTLDPVVYNKGESIEPAHLLLTPISYTSNQKPKVNPKDTAVRYVDEKEFRYVLTCTANEDELGADGPPTHLTLTLDCHGICFLD